LVAVGSKIAAVPIGRIALVFICFIAVPPTRAAFAAARSAAALCPEDDREILPLAQALLASKAARNDAQALMAALANARPDFQLLLLAAP
jgi:hypothetical protein